MQPIDPDEKTVRDLRAEFHADFSRAAAAGDDAGCLSPEEILSLQSGGELELVALEHLAHCQLCSSLRQAIEVDPARMDEFRQAVRHAQTQPAQTAPLGRPAPFDWRLPMAALTAAASVLM